MKLRGQSALTCAVEAAVEATEHRVDIEPSAGRSEHWIQSYVGCRLNDAARVCYGDTDVPGAGVYVTYEAKASWLVSQAGGNKVAAPSSLFGERFDIALWSSDDDGCVFGLLEIKNCPNLNEESFEKDIRRLACALASWGGVGGSLDWGMYLFSVNKSARDKTSKSRLEAVKACCRDLGIVVTTKAEMIGSLEWIGCLLTCKV